MSPSTAAKSSLKKVANTAMLGLFFDPEDGSNIVSETSLDFRWTDGLRDVMSPEAGTVS
jgi:hypothetical protein